VAVSNGKKSFEVIGVYPNIVRSSANLNLTSNKNTRVNVIVTNEQGVTVKKSIQFVVNGSNIIPMDFSNLSKGVYYINIQAEGYQNSVRFTKL